MKLCRQYQNGDQSEKIRQLLIELSTLPVDSKEKAREIAQKKNIRIIDSPLSGNRVVALQGKLSAYLSGDGRTSKEPNLF